MFIKFRDILYNFDNSVIKINTKTKFSQSNEYIETKPNLVLEKQIFNIKNTQTPDVYLLYKDNTFIGNACVNTLSVSKFLSNLFKDTHLQMSFNVECVYNTKFEKWTPIVLAN